MSELLDMLLRTDLPDMRKQLPQAQFEVPRLSSLAEKPVRFTLRALPYGRVQELKELEKDVPVHILLAGCEDPRLKDEKLLEKLGAATPVEAVKSLLLPGEIEDLSQEVERLCGYRRRTIAEVKNV